MKNTKVLILATFFRRPLVDGRDGPKETYLAGQTVTVSEADAADWIAKGLARPRDPLDHDGDGRKGGSFPKTPG